MNNLPINSNGSFLFQYQAMESDFKEERLHKMKYPKIRISKLNGMLTNAAIHLTNNTESFAGLLRIKVLPLPSYSPIIAPVKWVLVWQRKTIIEKR
jgi:transposase